MAHSQQKDWGTAALGQFMSTKHHEIYPAIDATRVKLPQPYVVCVVGASRGIGAAAAISYAKAGASGLVLASRKISGLQETASTCHALRPEIEIQVVSCDITSASSVASLAEAIKARFSRLDVVVVNSGYSGPVVLNITETEPFTFQNAINVNYVGTFLCAKYLIPLLLMSEGGGAAFIAVSSFAALIVRGDIANSQYCVSKAAQLKLIEHIHEQYADAGLSTFLIHPGAVASEMADETAPESFRQYLIDSPELCGAFAVWLTKEKGKRDWLCGRLLSANWDVEELVSKQDKIIEGDMLKLRLAL